MNAIHEIHFPKTQIFLMIATVIMFITFLYKPLKEFRSDDLGPTIVAATKEETEALRNQDRIVETHIAIYDAPKFNKTANKYEFHGYIIFTYNPKTISKETIEQFTIQKGTLNKSTPTIIDHKDGKQSAHFIIDGSFSMQIDYKDYPLDDHLVSFALINHAAKPQELLYVMTDKDFGIEDEYSMARWKDVGHSVTTGYLQKEFAFGKVEYPAILLSIDYAHDAIRQTIIILLPLFLVFFLTTFILSLNPDPYHRVMIGTATGGVSANMAYRYVIESLSPKVGYFMLSDYLFFLFFFTVFLNFLFAIFIEHIPENILRWLIIGQYCWVLSFCGYFLLFWL